MCPHDLARDEQPEPDTPRAVVGCCCLLVERIENAGAPVFTEFRDDRFAAAFERRKEDTPVYSVAYVVRAVSPGDYVLPQATVEDMYRPDRFGRTGTGTVTVAPVK